MRLPPLRSDPFPPRSWMIVVAGLARRIPPLHVAEREATYISPHDQGHDARPDQAWSTEAHVAARCGGYGRRWLIDG